MQSDGIKPHGIAHLAHLEGILYYILLSVPVLKTHCTNPQQYRVTFGCPEESIGNHSREFSPKSAPSPLPRISLSLSLLWLAAA